MKNGLLSIPLLHRLRARLRYRRRRAAEPESALRAELFSADQMGQYGAELASRHRTSAHTRTDALLARLSSNHALLGEASDLFTQTMRDGRRITPAAEWLLDNYYLIEEQVRTAQRHLPKGYSRELPVLLNGPCAGLPRVYEIAQETIAHGDGHVEVESLRRFVASYQTVAPLTLGELWAIPIMLRLALIENLRRVAASVMTDWGDRRLAVHWANRMSEVAERDPKSVVLAVADMARSNPPMVSPFVAELARRLQGQSPALVLPLTWVEQRLTESGQSIEHLVRMEAQQQAADQVSIGNSIGSLRTLSAMDWRGFVESTSLVEGALREEPAGAYAQMDFATRDQYRRAVEQLARNSALSELEVAEAAVTLAREGGSGERPEARGHVGFYLVDSGLEALEARVGARATPARVWRRLVLRGRRPLVLYLGLIALLTVLLAWPLVQNLPLDSGRRWPWLLLAIPVVLVSSQLAISLVNWLATVVTDPRALPRMDYDGGLPSDKRSVVAVPAMLTDADDVDELAEGLLVRYLANRDRHLHFALLTDFADAAAESQPQDEGLLEMMRERIEALNATYADAETDRFFLFHRPRLWNPSERSWGGRERKRGKLADLNAWLRGGARDAFALVVGRTEVLADVRYVITLDADTQLPRDSARRLVGAMAHPLNTLVFDSAGVRVVAGHAILQPRVGISLSSAMRSAYARLFGSDAGIDPYTRVVSDVYQDLFDEGSFIGKGIYDLDAFEKVLGDRFPDNHILSHDLVEGCYARSGLISDVQLYEEYPARYIDDARRRHRWIRGDWQLLPWLLPWAPARGGGWRRNPLTALSRWKILDNLRRSLVPPSLLVLLLFGWLSHAVQPSWTIAVLMVVLVPLLLASLLELFQKPRDAVLDQHLRAAMRDVGQHAARAALGLVWLPHEALYSLDAALRTLWRLFVSRRNLLQWAPSRQATRAGRDEPGVLWRAMWIAPLLGILVGAALLWTRPAALGVAAPFLLLWLLAPAVAWRISRPQPAQHFDATPTDVRFLRRLARKTWAFFESHVGAQENWLPPDNRQEQPEVMIAHRTSPTNMGMALLANLSAWDLGYVSVDRLLQRTDGSLRTMQNLPRYRGHFYNWYDTLSLQPLPPRYVSTVDSGNLAGHLITLRTGLLELADAPLFERRQLDGLADTLELLERALTAENRSIDVLADLRRELDATLAQPPANVKDAVACMERLADLAGAGIEVAPNGDAEVWLQALREQCIDARDYLRPFIGWPAEEGDLAIPSLRQLAHIDEAEASIPLLEARRRAAGLLTVIERLAGQSGALAVMDYGFLHDAKRELLSIGYNVDERRLDAGFYDLLASEARLTSFVAIAQGQLSQDSWFALGRLLTVTGGEPVLLSWSGSMFEYLMPMLVMPSYGGTLLDQTCRAAVARQIEYGRQLGLPWGVSESGYNTMDVHFNYQYRAFGVPGLGLKRGLGEEVVVAPYATALALMVAPKAACANLQRLAEEGLEGRYGLHEAVDYTPARLPHGQQAAVIRSYMAHHQGMSLLALDHLLCDQPMQRRFAADPALQSALLLLQERVPRSAAEYRHTASAPAPEALVRGAGTRLRVFADPDRPRPAVQLLSNGHYHVMVSSAGGGYSRCRELAVTRWHEDISRDDWGQFCYLRDVESGVFWSAAHQPVRRRVDFHEAIFSDARAEFRVRERDFDTHTEIVVSPEDDIELRRMRVTNCSRTRRTVEITSYAEVVLAKPQDDAMHPAFSKLFVQTELVRALQAIVCTRRPRSADDHVPWMCHLLAVHGADIDEISYETDRARFIGRNRNLAAPQALAPGEAHRKLSDSEGPVLDPVVAIRCRITLEPEQSARVDLVTGMGESRDACLRLIEKYRDRHLADRVFDLAWTHSQVLLRQLNASLADAQLYEHMATSIVYANPSLRADPGILRANRRGQSGLWGQAVSGDLPIVLLHIADPAHIELVRQLVQAHAYWRLKGLAVDLVIWNEDHAGYHQQLRDQIMGLIASGVEANLIDRPGGIFVRSAQQLSGEERLLMQASARLVLSDQLGGLAEQIGRRRVQSQPAPFRAAEVRPAALLAPAETAAHEELALRNRYGGFAPDGSEYVVTLSPGQATPAPWANVLANAQFGTVISESGNAYTWSENAHEFRLTPWSNDPVTDTGGEAIYLRDEQTGEFWSPTPLPCRGLGDYRTRHGFGYSVFEHEQDGIRSELWVYVAQDAPVKFSVLRVRNTSGRTRRLSATGYVEWVLGDLRDKAAMHVVTSSDPATGALMARNAWNEEFVGRVAFIDVDHPARSISGDRVEFLGRNGSLRQPAAMANARLSGQVGAGLDPCGAVQVVFDLDDDDEYEVIFRLGAATDAKAASDLVQRFRRRGTAAAALEAVRMHWHWTLGKVQVHTPDPAVDVLANGWLMYQVIACRFLARSGYYQSGGAIGFRDQLQDAMAMVYASPYAVRQHLLLCAAHQFPEGDVQHWWHPPLDRGVRTRCSDDFLWLPLAASRFVEVTADTGVLDEQVGYIEGRPLGQGEESYYDLPTHAELRESLYEHCKRAIGRAAARGPHGLPLMGSGDWNDGMNKVGEGGRGESVWLGFFLYHVLQRFVPLARQRGDEAFAQQCVDEAAALRENLDKHAWDGDWYRRAWFDDGTPLGSATDPECRIDSIAQSWSVLSGAGDAERRHQAMDALDEHLVRRDAGLIQLLDPPFDKSDLDPGYIKGYLPGVRENGGQYTHAAVWAAMAFAELGDSARAWELLGLINPVNHGKDEGIATYKVEPYVVTADVYGRPPHVGRGGWSWYTGSAGWLYRLIVDSLLGLRVEGERLRLLPLLPQGWDTFTMDYRFRETDYRIEVHRVQEGEAERCVLDGHEQDDDAIALVDDGRDHRVEVFRR
ncbi:glucoamylase family protein [Rhodanobacter sp. DHG33]|uniref:GH36-type glycosyl hydrolase domain-containing protein n=1 Tax=Rhodanobacter sp. DHG33 TaxID=2775921 RepID=UPI0031BA1E64